MFMIVLESNLERILKPRYLLLWDEMIISDVDLQQ